MQTRIFLLLIVATVFASFGAHADYDPRDDPNSPQSRAASRVAKEAAAKAKRKRDAEQAITDKKTADVYRGIYKDKAEGLSDKEVIAARPQWDKAAEASAQKQAADVLASMPPTHLAMMERQMGKEKFEKWKASISGLRVPKSDVKK